MKVLHTQFVSKCQNEVECKFGPKKFWFLHQENVEIAYQNAKDRDQKNDNGMIFDMEWIKNTLIKILTNSNNKLYVTHDPQL